MSSRVFVGPLSAALALLLTHASPTPAQTPLTATTVASGLDKPVFAVAPATDFERLFVLELTGKIRILEDGGMLPAPFLDLAGVIQQTSIQGLFGMAFHPDYESNGYFYVYYAGQSQNAVLARYQVTANPEVADPGSAFVLLDLPQPAEGHEGGMPAFGPDGYLYLALGDGEPQNDVNCNGQNGQLLLAKMIRIDVDGGLPYAIPPDNPFVGNPSVLDEIWASGLRHPWRFSFDRVTGDLYISDNGQDRVEELDFESAGFAGGRNYGWPVMEGSECFALNACSGGHPPCNDPTFTSPMYEYDHINGAGSVIGGYVYRGCAIPDLVGTYFFADYSFNEVYSLRFDGTTVTEFQDRTAALEPPGGFQAICSFAEDAHGELYIIDHVGGTLRKIVPATPTAPLPCITELSPDSGSAQGGVRVTLAGTGFSGVTEVTFGGVPATNLVAVQPANPAGIGEKALLVTTPPGNVDTVDVSITNLVGSTTLVGGFTYEPAGSFVDIGPSGIPGTLGEPQLGGDGDLTPGSLAGFDLQCANAQPFALGFLFVSDETNPHFPFFGGTFYPLPILYQDAFGFDADGIWAVHTSISPIIPSGVSLTHQFFFQDATGPFGVTGSNGLRLDIP